MASIDQYNHELLGFVECPSDYDFVYENPTREIAIYRLLQDVPKDELDFDGKINDLIIGGGSGEAKSLRICVDKCIDFFIHEDLDSFEITSDLYKSYWTPTFSYIIGTGFSKLGWTPELPLEEWLTKRILDKLITESKIKVFD